MLEKNGNRIYIKYNKEDKIGYFSGIISLSIFGIFIINYFEKIKIENKWINGFIHNNSTKTFFIIGVIVFVIVNIMNKLFYSDYQYYIDLEDNKIHLINGRWKFKNEYSIDLKNIKNIVIIKIEKIIDKYENKIDIYKIDLYDNELNAYEIFDSTNYKVIIKMAIELRKIFETEIIERTNTNDYEGFRKRII